MSEGYHAPPYPPEQDGYTESAYTLPYIDTSSQSASVLPGQTQDRQSASDTEHTQPGFPTKASQFAATYKLGKVLTKYKHEAHAITTSGISSLLVGTVILLIVVITLLMSIRLPYRIGSMMTGICLFSYGLTQTSRGLYDWIASYIKNVQFYLCTDGVMCIKRDRGQGIRWDQISTIQKIVIPNQRSRALQQYLLYPETGEPVELDAGFIGFNALGIDIEHKVTQRLLPATLTAHKAGQILNFGPLNVTSQGLSTTKAPEAELPWTQLGIIGEESGYLIIRTKGKVSTWAIIEISEIINLCVFHALINEIRKDIRLTSNSSADLPTYQPPANTSLASEWQNYE